MGDAKRRRERRRAEKERKAQRRAARAARRAGQREKRCRRRAKELRRAGAPEDVGTAAWASAGAPEAGPRTGAPSETAPVGGRRVRETMAAVERLAGRVRPPDANRGAWHALCRAVVADQNSSALVRRERVRILRLLCEELGRAGYQGLTMRGLRSRHVKALVREWKRRGLSASRTAKLLGHLRWWARTVGKDGLVLGSNAAYGLSTRSAVGTGQRGTLDLEALVGRVPDERTRLSLALQWEFGLSPEESIKFAAARAVRDDCVVVPASWGSRRKGRTVPVRWVSQRALLGVVREVGGDGPLIAPGRSYAGHRADVYEPLAARFRVGRVHGLRWAYARRRFLEEVGVKCAAAGGPDSADMDAAMRAAARRATAAIAKEMGVVHAVVREVFLGFADRGRGRSGARRGRVDGGARGAVGTAGRG